MSKLIRVTDALICCGGNSAQLLKDARANFQGLAAEFLEQASRGKQAGAAAGSIVQFVVQSLAPVIIGEARFAEFVASLGLGAGFTASQVPALQGMEWIPPELQLKADPANWDYGALTLEQADVLYKISAEQALARHRDRVRRCHVERSLPQTSKAVYFRGSSRSRRLKAGGFASGVWRRIVNLIRRPR